MEWFLIVSLFWFNGLSMGITAEFSYDSYSKCEEARAVVSSYSFYKTFKEKGKKLKVDECYQKE